MSLSLWFFFIVFLFFFFFFKQKTAYEMRISDWSQTCALPISLLRAGGDQHRLGMLRLDILDDRARIGEQEAIVVHRGHLAERRGGAEARVGVADADALQLEFDPLLAQIAEQLAHERRHH